jgi:ABC-2 type transport system permease protein
MSTATVAFPRIGLPGLSSVELRKMVDTRAGFWLLLVIQLLAVGSAGALLVAAEPDDRNFVDFFIVALWVTAILLPVLGILAVTSEWSQRTGLTTFALVPQRGRVIGAKLVAATILTLVSVAVCLLVATLGNLASGGSWSFGLDGAGRGALYGVLAMAGGFALGLTFMNSALAITLYFTVPTAWTALGDGIRALEKPAQWLDMERAAGPLLDANVAMNGTDWAQIATASALWIGLFLLVGLWRLRRTELK